MKKLFVLLAVILVFFSGCVEEDIDNQTSASYSETIMKTQEPIKEVIIEEKEEIITQQENETQETDKNGEEQTGQNSTATSSETKKQIKELENLLDELGAEEFGDIDFSE